MKNTKWLCFRRDSSHDDNHHPHNPDHPEDQGSGGRVVQGGREQELPPGVRRAGRPAQRQPGQRRAHRQGWRLRGGGGHASAQPRRGTSESRQETEQRRERVVRVDMRTARDVLSERLSARVSSREQK